MSESFLVMGLLSVVGGYLDAYTYLCRGGVFANAQTGNIAALGFHIVDGQWYDVWHRVLMIGCFISGILLCDFIESKLKQSEQLHWRQIVVLAEAVVIGVISFIPGGAWDMVCNAAVSFVCAMQVECFRKVRGVNVASTMCTGSLRSGTQQLYKFLKQHNRQSLYNCLKYYTMILLFVCGVVIGAALTNVWNIHAALVCSGVLFLVFGLLFIKQNNAA